MNVSAGGRLVPVESMTSLEDYISSKVGQEHQDDDNSFFAINLGRVNDLYKTWMSALPRVQPFYAVKCNDDPVLLKVLTSIVPGFDCASKNEIATILDLGVSPDRIIFANPCKQISHIKYAASKGVRRTAFDSETELNKLKTHHPNARLVLRLIADHDPDSAADSGSQGSCIKFGCTVAVGKELLQLAKKLDLDVIGTSFHIGIGPSDEGCKSPVPYQTALKLSAEMFLFGTEIGYNFTLLDIGGGYPGGQESEESFLKLAEGIRKGLGDFFATVKQDQDIRVIAEPGRFFAKSTHALAVCIHNKKKEEDGSMMYYTNDGVFGGFGSIPFPPNSPTKFNPKPLLKAHGDPSAPLYRSTFWGPCCESDKYCVATLPELNVGDWVYFEDMGAYTASISTTYNGFPKPVSHYYTLDSQRKALEKTLTESSPYVC